MAKCPNKNTVEYKALQSVYKTEIATNNVINLWQKTKDSDAFPTVTEAAEYTKKSKLAYALKQKSFGESLLKNLQDKGYIVSFGGRMMVKRTFKGDWQASKAAFDYHNNLINQYLKINNIPQKVVARTQAINPLTRYISIDPKVITPKDMLPKTRAWDQTRAVSIITHLNKLFPQLKIRVLSVKDAKKLHALIPKSKRLKDASFDNVNSFYYQGAVILVKGRVTNEIAIEEVLHPFTDAIQNENPTLYNGLLSEAKKNFPEMVEEIRAAYSSSQRFSDQERDMEIVTQALARHFKKEYETKPTTSFINLVKEALEWLRSVINNFHELITGGSIPISQISSTATFSDIAKLLNTEAINFDLNIRKDIRVKYSLSPEKQRVIDKVKGSANGIQKEIVDKLMHVAKHAPGKPLDTLSVSEANANKSDTIMVFDEKSHTYMDILNGEVYLSATTAIKGQLTNKEGEAKISKAEAIKNLTGQERKDAINEWNKKIKEGKRLDTEKLESVELNLDLGNDLDRISDAIVAYENVDDIIKDMKILNEEQARDAFKRMGLIIDDLMPPQSIALSQVIVFDKATKTAGTADLIIIEEDGSIRIVDLKTSKNSILETQIKPTITGFREETRYEGNAWKLPADSKLRQKGVLELSTNAQHNLQVNLYRRMFENMGYTVSEGDMSASTFHIKVDIKGKGKEQKYVGTWKFEGSYDHTETLPSENRRYVDMLIPSTKDNVNKQKMDTAIKDQENSSYRGDQDTNAKAETKTTVEAKSQREVEAIYATLEQYSVALQESMTASSKGRSVFTTKTEKEQRDYQVRTLAYINQGMNRGPNEQSKVYSALLSDALKQIREFTAYISDPNNVSKREFISYVLNFNRFISSYEILYNISDSPDLNATQKTLVLKLLLERNKLVGGSVLKSGREGLVNDAIFSFVKEVVRNRSNKKFGVEGGFTEQDLIDELTIGNDISTGDLLTRDLATQDDTLLGVIDKIYKEQKQILLDKIAFRENVLSTAANKLLKLDGRSKNQIYEFMLDFDSEGKRTGNYVKEIGGLYADKQFELRQALMDVNGHMYQYRDVTDILKATQEDIDYNIALALKKRANSNFWKAERSDENGNRIDGEYHRYTDEFLQERRKWETWISNGTYGKWQRKIGVKDAEYDQFILKYFDNTRYTKAKIDTEGNPTGVIEKKAKGMFPKVKYRIANSFTVNEDGTLGQDMRSEKYKAIFDPSKTDALSIAQREFYEIYIQYYEKELLAKLPDNTRQQMLGKIPLVRDTLLDDIKNKSGFFTKMFAGTVRTVKNLVTETATQKTVLLDENGNFINSMPVGFTGSPRVEGALEAAQAELTDLENTYKKGRMSPERYNADKAVIQGRIAKLRIQPSVGEISPDLGSSLLKFSAMAEHYEVMGEIEDTLQAIIRVIKNKEYSPSDKNTSLLGRTSTGILKKVGFTKETSGDSNVLKRAQAYMSMVYYDNELVSQGFFDKFANALISQSSLAYVAFNPFGNFNNYLMGKINNNIEMLGSRFFSKKSYFRASKEYNVTALPGIIQRTGSGVADMTDIATLGLLGINKSDYDPDKANNKYEAFVDLFRMMDDSTDIRESSRKNDTKSLWSRFKAWGYVMQDAAEYNVQTKVGIAMLMDIDVLNENTGETLSLYDAMQFNGKTHELSLPEGFTKVINKDGTIEEYTDKWRYAFRNKVREVNKQIHGNYAAEDRMVIQSYTLGNLAAQFHKWVAPAIRARFQGEYFDENLGWMEGRYKSFWKFLAYSKQQIWAGNRDIRKYGEGFKKVTADQGGGFAEQRASNKLFGVYRTMGEISIIMTVSLINTIMDSVLAGEGDDDDTQKRLKHLARYQGDRLYKELILFVDPVQMFQMAKSPIVSAKALGNLGEALKLSFWTPAGYIIKGKDGFYSDSEYVYQNKPNKGQLKVNKAWRDAMPILYSIQKWENLIKEQKFLAN